MKIQLIYTDGSARVVVVDPASTILESLKSILSSNQCLLYDGSIVKAHNTYITRQVRNNDMFDVMLIK